MTFILIICLSFKWRFYCWNVVFFTFIQIISMNLKWYFPVWFEDTTRMVIFYCWFWCLVQLVITPKISKRTQGERKRFAQFVESKNSFCWMAACFRRMDSLRWRLANIQSRHSLQWHSVKHQISTHLTEYSAVCDHSQVFASQID